MTLIVELGEDIEEILENLARETAIPPSVLLREFLTDHSGLLHDYCLATIGDNRLGDLCEEIEGHYPLQNRPRGRILNPSTGSGGV